MRKLLNYIRVLINLSHTNLIKTIYFNFKFLPFKRAIKFPFYIYGKITFRSMKGRVFIHSALYPGMIKIGKKDCYVETTIPQCIWTVNGTINFFGACNFLQGSYVLVAKNAELNIGSNGTVFGSNVKIICFSNISIKNAVGIAWDCQIMDTSFHYIEDTESKESRSLTKPICIGDNVWIGNRVTISKGSIIPDHTIIASNSLVNKDLSEMGCYCFLAGQPVKIVRRNVRSFFNTDEERRLDRKFGYNRTYL